MDSPPIDVDFPVKVLEEVDNWLERVVGAWFRVGELVEQELDSDLVFFVEEEMFTEGCQGGVGDGGKGIRFNVVGGEEECQVALSG